MDERSREELISTHDELVRKTVEGGLMPKEWGDFALRLRSDDQKVRIVKGKGIKDDPAMAAFGDWWMQQELRWMRQQLWGEGEKPNGGPPGSRSA